MQWVPCMKQVLEAYALPQNCSVTFSSSPRFTFKIGLRTVTMEQKSVAKFTDWRKLVCCPDASPTQEELPVWTQVEEVLQQTDEILLELSVYRGATTQIRDVSQPVVEVWGNAGERRSPTSISSPKCSPPQISKRRKGTLRGTLGYADTSCIPAYCVVNCLLPLSPCR